MPIWLQVVLALAGVATASAAAFFAWHQAQTNRVRLQNELFERRFEVFQAVHAYLSYVVREGGVKFEEKSLDQITELHIALQRSWFLFGNEISDYIETIEDKAREVLVLEGHAEKPAKLAALRMWASAETTRLFDVFAPYLKIDVAAHRPSERERLQMRVLPKE